MDGASFRKSVLQTLAFFDVFDYALTKEELYRLLWDAKKISFSSFIHGLEILKDSGVVESLWGHFFLPGRSSIVNERRRRFLIAEKKMRIAKRAARLVSYIPFVRGVYLCNTVSFGVPKHESDVDFFIVLKHGRMWIGRLLVTGVLELFKMRRSKDDVKDKICLSFYISDERLNLADIALSRDDIYLVYWLTHLVPLFDSHKTYARVRAANHWLKFALPHADGQKSLSHHWQTSQSMLQKWVERLPDALFDALDSKAKTYQMRRMAQNTGSIQHEPDTRVVISDTMLKFHENDRRAHYRKLWQMVCRAHQIV